jgi:hypothetical protein
MGRYMYIFRNVGLVVLFVFAANCTDRADCRLRYGGVGYFATYPPGKDGSISDSAELRYVAEVIVSREKTGKLSDFQSKLFRLRVARVSDGSREYIYEDCIALEAGRFEVKFDWFAPEALSVAIDFEGEDNEPRQLIKNIHISDSLNDPR